MVIKFGTLSVAGSGRNLDVSQSTDEIDVTTYGSTDKEFIVGFVDRTATLEILDQNNSSTIRTAFSPGSVGSLTWFPIGTASGNPKFFAATAVVQESNKTYPYDGAVLLNVTMRISGTVTESTADGSGN
jgi:hypothetical protein